MKKWSNHPARISPIKTTLYEVHFLPWEDTEGLHETSPIRVFEINVVRAAINATFCQMRLYLNIGIKKIVNCETGEEFFGVLNFVVKQKP